MGGLFFCALYAWRNVSNTFYFGTPTHPPPAFKWPTSLVRNSKQSIFGLFQWCQRDKIMLQWDF
jgi:hypothetical protein